MKASPKLQVVQPVPFQIEFGIPRPDVRKFPGRAPGEIVTALRALAEAPIGASVFIPGKKPAKIGPYFKLAGGAGWYSTRAVEGGCRAWKVSEPKAKA